MRSTLISEPSDFHHKFFSGADIAVNKKNIECVIKLIIYC